MAEYDPNGLLGVIIQQFSENISGDLNLTIFYGFMMLFLITLGVGLPSEISIFVILPLLIVLMAFSGQFVLVGLLVFFFIAAVLAKTFFLR